MSREPDLRPVADLSQLRERVANGPGPIGLCCGQFLLALEPFQDDERLGERVLGAGGIGDCAQQIETNCELALQCGIAGIGIGEQLPQGQTDPVGIQSFFPVSKPGRESPDPLGAKCQIVYRLAIVRLRAVELLAHAHTRLVGFECFGVVIQHFVHLPDALVAGGQIALPSAIAGIAQGKIPENRESLEVFRQRVPMLSLQRQRIGDGPHHGRDLALIGEIAGVAVGHPLARGERLSVKRHLPHGANDPERVVVQVEIVDAGRIDDAESEPLGIPVVQPARFVVDDEVAVRNLLELPGADIGLQIEGVNPAFEDILAFADTIITPIHVGRGRTLVDVPTAHEELP